MSIDNKDFVDLMSLMDEYFELLAQENINLALVINNKAMWDQNAAIASFQKGAKLRKDIRDFINLIDPELKPKFAMEKSQSGHNMN